MLIGLVGRGIGSSRSPIMHEREGARLGLDYAYRLVDFDQLGLDDAALGAVIAAAEELGFSGLNVTHPFKQSVVPFLTELAPDAAAIGAVNTVVFKDGRRIGHNTDSWGFAESFRESMAGCGLDHVLQLGAGGAGAAVAHALLDLGVAHLALVDTATSRAEQLAESLNARFGRRVAVPASADTAFAHASGVVNATPVGMAKYPGCPLRPACCRPGTGWRRSSIFRRRRRCCGSPASLAAARFRASAWRSTRRSARSSCLPVSSPTRPR